MIITEDGGCDQSLTDVVPGDGDQHTELSHDLARVEEHLQSADWTIGMEEIMVSYRPSKTLSDQRNFIILYLLTESHCPKPGQSLEVGTDQSSRPDCPPGDHNDGHVGPQHPHRPHVCLGVVLLSEQFLSCIARSQYQR